MFLPKTIRVFSVAAIILSVAGVALSILFLSNTRLSLIFGIISWSLLLWASIIGYKLSYYKLYDNEYKKVGSIIYLILISFVVFLFVGIMIGFIISVILLSSVWGIKRNYDEWVSSHSMISDRSLDDAADQ